MIAQQRMARSLCDSWASCRQWRKSCAAQSDKQARYALPNWIIRANDENTGTRLIRAGVLRAKLQLPVPIAGHLIKRQLHCGS